jgi:hypothetical protein
MNNIITARYIAKKLKGRMCKTIIKSRVAYVSETWTINKK